MKNETNLSEMNVHKIILKAVDMIKDDKHEDAIALLREVASHDVENPEVYNLLGIIYERDGDIINATKYYRVAYYMDQGFKAASENLDRLNDLYYKGFSNVSWGLDRIGGGSR